MIFQKVKKQNIKVNAMIAENSTSVHDVESQFEFFSNFKFKYEKFYGDLCQFRIVVIDYSWASIHSLLLALNLEDINSYSMRIFQMSQDKFEIDINKSYLVSCVGHTMNRFSKSIKKFNLKQEKHQFLCFLFSLMLNSTCLIQINEYFKHICVIYLSIYKTVQLKESETFIEKALLERPDYQEMGEFILQIQKRFQIIQSDQTDEVEADQVSDIVVEIEDVDLDKTDSDSVEFAKQKTKTTIKENSPFTKNFLLIRDNVCLSIDANDLIAQNLNYNFNRAIIEHLLDNYMPYCFIWASFVLKVSWNF